MAMESDDGAVETETCHSSSVRFQCVIVVTPRRSRIYIYTFALEMESGGGVEVKESAAFVQEKETAFS